MSTVQKHTLPGKTREIHNEERPRKRVLPTILNVAFFLVGLLAFGHERSLWSRSPTEPILNVIASGFDFVVFTLCLIGLAIVETRPRS